MLINPFPLWWEGRHAHTQVVRWDGGEQQEYTPTVIWTRTTTNTITWEWTYKAVEHGAGHPCCEAHVEEKQDCAWKTSSTTAALGAGVTILLLAAPAPLELVYPQPPLAGFSLLKMCWRMTSWCHLGSQTPGLSPHHSREGRGSVPASEDGPCCTAEKRRIVHERYNEEPQSDGAGEVKNCGKSWKAPQME